jgi:hypothetical protein
MAAIAGSYWHRGRLLDDIWWMAAACRKARQTARPGSVRNRDLLILGPFLSAPVRAPRAAWIESMRSSHTE